MQAEFTSLLSKPLLHDHVHLLQEHWVNLDASHNLNNFCKLMLILLQVSRNKKYNSGLMGPDLLKTGPEWAVKVKKGLSPPFLTSHN